MWYDATVAAGLLEADDSPVKGKNGYALAPVEETKASGWLWSLGARDPEDRRASGPRLEVHRVGDRPAIHQGRPGTQIARRVGGDPARHAARSTYEIPEYKKAAARVRRADARGDAVRADRQPRHDQAARLPGRAVRRHPAVPGRRQPCTAAVLAR